MRMSMPMIRYRTGRFDLVPGKVAARNIQRDEGVRLDDRVKVIARDHFYN
jgi:hypothetical protein